MSEGIMPGYPKEYHSTAPRFTHRGFSLVLNPASTLKIIWTRFLLSCISRFASVARDDAMMRGAQRS
jgi:hypothetical protein